ncbi:TetR/AcrR family transcriptional regulator [uncultured Erythrobacter sp.]|uniref:TetR/AcrR family transcriptional regulator n=1 Tax=uncultured Erythrobacter sp. TaxID=263913 RepID=UPI002613A691|nr:TetR/AcrR family transcriptional regulator [uncultured Erythrobacter sp.]
MNQASIAISDALKAEAPQSDGRHARSQASRSKIIQALMDLIVAGDLNPSTANIAKQAGVGLRSIFRHFDEKDAMYREVDAILVKAYKPIVEAPYKSDRWQDRLNELIERRCEVSEGIAPYRISTAAARQKSKFLKENYRRLHEAEKQRLNAILPDRIHTETAIGRAIMVATSFDTWRLLRQDENLSASETVEAVKQLVADIIESLAD